MICELVGLERFCDSNIAGVRRVEYLPIKWIDKALYQPCIGGVYNHQKAIPLLPNRDWLSVPLLCETRLWNENWQNDKQCGYYELSVTGELAGWNPAGAGELDKMVRQTFIIRLTCNDGQAWLLGSMEHPMRFSHTSTTSRKIGERKGHSVTWYNRQRRKSAGYVPIF